jgi:hypothetical protein
MIRSSQKGEFTKKFKKGPPIDGWKAEIVEAAIEKKFHPDFDASEYEEDDVTVMLLLFMLFNKMSYSRVVY